jgi:hypothetical protein
MNNSLMRRVARLENHQGACNHAAYLVNPSDEEIEQFTTEWAKCPRCRHKPQPAVLRINLNLDLV